MDMVHVSAIMGAHVRCLCLWALLRQARGGGRARSLYATPPSPLPPPPGFER